MTAAEAATYNAACPEWVAEQDAKQAELQQKEKRYLAEEAPLRDDLHRLGFHIKWVWDFVNSKENNYQAAIPTLLEHIQRPYSDEVREGIARSLAIREARGQAGGVLIAVLQERGLGHQLRWALANTLTVVADRSNRDAIRELLEVETESSVRDRLSRALRTAAKP